MCVCVSKFNHEGFLCIDTYYIAQNLMGEIFTDTESSNI